MLKKYIYSKLLDNLDFQPTPGQMELVEMLAGFITVGEMKEIFLIKGYAGTGKTSIIKSIVLSLRDIGQKSVLLAPTGRAAKVISSYTGVSAWTIHKKIYRQRSGSDGLGTFVLDRNMHKDTLFIVDEASMIGQAADGSIFGTGNLLSDLIRFVEDGQRCRIILIGDTAQLPPVKLNISPALDNNILKSYDYTVKEYTLTDVVRQALGSGILENATYLRKSISDNTKEIPRVLLNGFQDVERVNGADLLELISQSYDYYGEDDTILITRSNKRANKFNAAIRSQVFWREEQIGKGDHLMIVKNNYFWKDRHSSIDFIANGDIARIERIIGFEEEYGLRFANVELALLDYGEIEIEAKVILDTLDVEGPSLPQDMNRELYMKIMEEHPELSSKKKRSEYIIKDEFFNALQVKFSYAVTCHKAQGGQWKSVFLDQGYFTGEMLDIDYLRWLYTAYTRATEKLYLVNFSNEFFIHR